MDEVFLCLCILNSGNRQRWMVRNMPRLLYSWGRSNWQQPNEKLDQWNHIQNNFTVQVLSHMNLKQCKIYLSVLFSYNTTEIPCSGFLHVLITSHQLFWKISCNINFNLLYTFCTYSCNTSPIKPPFFLS
jgi:hypothetical protein